MIDITTIPTSELWSDREESEKDIVRCRQDLLVGYTVHKDGSSVQECIDNNYKIIEKINSELYRRGFK